MGLDEIVVVTARDFLETYGEKSFNNAVWFIQHFWPMEYSVRNDLAGIKPIEPCGRTKSNYRSGKTRPDGVNTIFRLEDASPPVSFPLTAGSPALGRISNLFAFIYCSGNVDQKTMTPSISSGAGDSERILSAYLDFPFTAREAPDNKIYVRPDDAAACLGRILVAMGVKTGAKAQTEADFPEYIKRFSALIREGNLTSTERDALGGYCMDFASIFLNCTGHVIGATKKGRKYVTGIRARLPSRHKPEEALKLASDASEFLDSLLNINSRAQVDHNQSTLASGKKNRRLPPFSFYREKGFYPNPERLCAKRSTAKRPEH